MQRDTMYDSPIYPRQLAVLTFFATMAFKVVMLPRYLSMVAPRDFVVGAIPVLLVEVAMFFAVYYVISVMPLASMNAHLRRLVALLVLVSTGIKFAVLSVETLSYISTMLFKEGRWLFIILTLFPVIGYVAYRGANTMARIAEIVVWAVGLTVIFTLVFMRADMDITSLLPIFDNGVENTVKAYAMHCIWFGDFLPFLTLRVEKSSRRIDKVAPYIGLAVTYLGILAFFVLFVVVYGEVAPYISYAFSNMGIYNSISNTLGGVEFPIVCVWLLVALIKLSFMFYTIAYSVENIFGVVNRRGHGIVVLVVGAITMLILSFGIEGTGDMYRFATSYVRYIVMAIDYTLPILLAIIVSIIARKIAVPK